MTITALPVKKGLFKKPKPEQMETKTILKDVSGTVMPG